MKIKDIVVLAIISLFILNLSACGGSGGGSTPPAPGIAVSKKTLTTTEDGTVDSFGVALRTQPTSDVEITFTSRDTTEGKIRSDHDTGWGADSYGTTVDLTFTPQNWNIAQVIDVQGQADSIIDGNQTYEVAVTWVWSMDLNYIGVAKPTVTVTNIDTSAAGVTVTPASLSTTEGGTSASFTVSLNLKPSSTVEVPLTISDPSEGSFSSNSSVTEKVLTFDEYDWSYGQRVYVYPVDDLMADGNQTYDITIGPLSSADTNYDGLTGDPVSVTNIDNDTADFTLSKNSLKTAEWGQTADFTVVLNTEPTADVVIPVTSQDPSEGLVSSETSVPATSLSLTFTSDNWQTPQTVTVTGQDDDLQDGDITYNILVGAPTGATEYAALTAKTVTVVNIDDDTAKIHIQGANLQTTEDGGTDTFIVSLAKAPSGNVIINVTSNDPTEGRVRGGSSPSVAVDAITLTFTPDDWQTAQTVTVVGQDDLEVDGNQTFTITVAVDSEQTADPEYTALSAQNVSVTNADNDVAGMTLSSSYVSAYESGTLGKFTVKLNTKPSADVILPVKVSDADQILVAYGGSGFVDSLNLTFTSANWSTPQEVSIQAIDDDIDEGWYTTYTITVGAASSADAHYEGLAARTVSVTVYDNDTAGFAITPASGLATSEDGTSANFTIALTSEPVANVFVTVSSGDTDEGLLTGGDSPTVQQDTVTLEFTPANWQSAQTVTVHGQDDDILDGPITYDLTVATVTGTDSRYNGVGDKKVSVTNSDNEVGVSETTTLLEVQLPYDGQVAPDSTSTYSIDLSAGWKYTVTAGNVTDDISLEVRDSGASTLCSSAKAGAKTEESCTFTTPGDGSVTIVINGAGTENGAGFTLSLSEPMITTRFETYGADGRSMFLYNDPANYFLKSGYYWGPGSGSFTEDLVAGKTYYLKVNGYYSNSVGAYKIQVTEGAASLIDYGTATTDTAGEPADNTAAGASILTLDTPLERYMSNSDTDWFVYTAPIP